MEIDIGNAAREDSRGSTSTSLESDQGAEALETTVIIEALMTSGRSPCGDGRASAWMVEIAGSVLERDAGAVPAVQSWVLSGTGAGFLLLRTTVASLSMNARI
jgi:hypothetical protein